MSDRVRVALIVVIVGLLAGGGGFYFFKIYRPQQDLKAAQDEIARWEARFQAVRDCLLGKTPGSARTSEALAIREMTPDPWDRGGCTALIKKLSRGDAPDTGLPAVEDAWVALDKSASKAALAFARHVSESTTLKEDPLPAALDDLDAARKTLRVAAKLPASEATGAPLAAAQILPLVDGTEPLTNIHVETLPSAHGMLQFGQTATHTLQIKLTAGAAPELRRVGVADVDSSLMTIRSVPDMSWGIRPDAAGLQAGGLDAEGLVPAPSALEMPTPVVAAVVGTADAGLVVYGSTDKLVLAHSKAGTWTPGEPRTINAAQSGIDVDGRVALVVAEATKTTGQLMTATTEEAAVELPPQVGRICLTKDRAWTQTWDTAVSFGGGRPVFKQQLTERLQGCTLEAALFHDASRPDKLVICSDECRPAILPSGAPQFATTTVVNGKLVGIASHGGVLGVWREGKQPVFYALPEAATPVLAHEWPAMALTDGKVIDILARGAKTFVVIRVPAT